MYVCKFFHCPFPAVYRPQQPKFNVSFNLSCTSLKISLPISGLVAPTATQIWPGSEAGEEDAKYEDAHASGRLGVRAASVGAVCVRERERERERECVCVCACEC